YSVPAERGEHRTCCVQRQAERTSRMCLKGGPGSVSWRHPEPHGPVVPGRNEYIARTEAQSVHMSGLALPVGDGPAGLCVPEIDSIEYARRDQSSVSTVCQVRAGSPFLLSEGRPLNSPYRDRKDEPIAVPDRHDIEWRNSHASSVRSEA